MIPELGRSPGEGDGHLLWYSCLENLMDRGAWRRPRGRFCLGGLLPPASADAGARWERERPVASAGPSLHGICRGCPSLLPAEPPRSLQRGRPVTTGGRGSPESLPGLLQHWPSEEAGTAPGVNTSPGPPWVPPDHPAGTEGSAAHSAFSPTSLGSGRGADLPKADWQGRSPGSHWLS